MEPGDELDALVAVKVMGWRIKEGLYPVDATGQSQFVVPSYSTDIAAAWLVVEHFTNQGKHFDISSTIRGSIADIKSGVRHLQWVALVRNFPFARADTAPHAICIAALKAVGCEVPA